MAWSYQLYLAYLLYCRLGLQASSGTRCLRLLNALALLEVTVLPRTRKKLPMNLGSTNTPLEAGSILMPTR